MPLPQNAYELLSEQTDGFRLVLDGLPIGLMLADQHGTFLMCNREAERIFGPCVTALATLESCGNIYCPDKMTRFSPGEFSLSRAARGEEVIRELIFVRNNATGLESWVRTSSRPLKDASGCVCGAVAVFFDSTELQRLVEQTSLLSLAVEQTADSVVITDIKGIIEYVNPAFETTTGYTSKEALGKTPAILKSGQQDSAFYAELWKQLLGGESFRGTLVNRRKMGELYWAEQTITPMTNAEGRITHFVSLLKDVTEQIRHQEQKIQLALAREVQQRLYASAVTVVGLDTGAVAWPADETGGDYFDFISTDKDSLTAAIGDVSTHGISAALGMALTRAYVRSSVVHGLNVPSALTSINNMLFADLEESHYVTLVLVRLDMTMRMLTYASAGHVSGFLFHASGKVDLLDSTDVPLGLFKDRHFTSRSIPIEAGQTLILLTDGITESGGSAQGEVGPEPIIDFVRTHGGASAQQIAEGICRTARAFAGDDPQQDDITAVVVKVL